MVELALIALTTIGSVVGDGSVRGRILSDRDEPVAGVQVELSGSGRVAWSDAAGRYELDGLEPGDYEIRFSRFAYDPLSLTITVPDRGALELDVELQTRFVLQPGIDVVTAAGGSGGSSPFLSSGLPEIGSRELPAEMIWSSPLVGLPDALATLRTVIGVDLAEESATQLHVRGGSADQNLVLVDGAPVYNGYHTSGILSAVSPDILSGMVVHTGILPARYGGRLSSVVHLETGMPGAVQVRGGLGLPDARLAARAPLGDGAGEVLLGGRRTTYDLVRRGYARGSEDSGFEDVLGRITWSAAGGTLRVLSLHTDNWLSSFAGGGGEGGAEPLAGFPDHHNGVGWSSGTDAVSWSRSTRGGSEARLQLFRAATRSNVEWGTLGERRRLHHRLVHWGLSGDLAWEGAASVGRAGLALERIGTRYTTESRWIGEAGVAEAGQDGPYDLEAEPTILSSYMEQRWIPRDHWMINAGLRAIHVEGAGPALEPRVSAHYRPIEPLTVSVGYGRVHQYVQSLTNEESLLNSAYAIEPLVAVGAPDIPLARSDQLAAALEARLAERLLVRLDGYARWLDGIVLVAPATAQPFVTGGFLRGTGVARGMGAELVYEGGRLAGRALIDWSSVRRSTADLSYRPRFERRRSLAMEAAYRALPSLTFTSALQVAAGPPTSLVAGGFDWDVFDQLTGEVDFRGTPMRAPGAINAERLPAYVRLDLGVRREWRVPADGAGATITSYFGVVNVLDRRNVIGRQLTADGSGTRDLLLRPRSLLFGIEWRY